MGDLRHDFTQETIRKLGERVGLLCSNPDCRAATKGPHTASEKAASVGKACHIHAAAPGGPRYDSSQTEEERRSIDNGIWLCSNCGTLVDNDAPRFPPDRLREWRAKAELDALARLGRPRPSTAPVDGVLRTFLVEVERVREVAQELNQVASNGPWTRIVGTRINGALVEGLLEKVVPLLANDSVLLGNVKNLRTWIITSDSIAASFAMSERPNEWQLRDLRQRAAEAARNIVISADHVLTAIRARL